MGECIIIDRSKVIRKFIKIMLDDLAFSSQEAGNGKEGLELCLKTIPDLVIVGWKMPMMDGVTFAKKFRKKFPGVKTKIIFCVMEEEVNMVRSLMESKNDEFLIKPFDIEVLRTKLLHLGLIQEEML